MIISEKNPDIEKIEALRKQFVRDFDREVIENLTLEQYAMRTGDKSNFCYRLEREQMGMGNITGSTAQKFGVWVRKSTGEYDYTSKYGNTVEEAYSTLHNELCDLIDAGLNDDYYTIRKNMIAPLVKYKILAMYYLDKFLTIHAMSHLSYFCSKAGIPYSDDDDELILQRKLILWKNREPDICELNLLYFVAYLYDYFGKPPVSEKGFNKKKTKLKIMKDELKEFDLKNNKKKLTEVQIQERSELIRKITKERAAGVCQLCHKPAPFYTKNGEAYLECHHVIWLAKGGRDELYNTVALCPNCHRKMHYLDDEKDVDYLKKVARAI